MANTNRPNGFRPVMGQFGNFHGLIRKYEAGDRSTDTTNNHGDIYVGDVVKLTSGKALPANSNDTVLGVVVGVGTAGTHGDAGMFKPASLDEKHLAYNESGYVWVVPAEGNLFEVQSGSDLDLLAGSQADISVDAGEAHGSRTTGQSNAVLVADTNHDVEVIEVVSSEDNDSTLAYTRYVVQFTKTQHAQ